jgi:hypothetical protein
MSLLFFFLDPVLQVPDLECPRPPKLGWLVWAGWCSTAEGAVHARSAPAAATGCCREGVLYYCIIGGGIPPQVTTRHQPAQAEVPLCPVVVAATRAAAST